MPTILLEQIIELLTGWKDSFFTWANNIGDKIASIKTNTDSLPDIKDNTDDIKDNTAAVITPISNINTNVTSISSDTASIRTDTGIIKNNAQAIATSSGQAAAYAQDVANNTLEVKNKVVTIASDTTQMRADSGSIRADVSEIKNTLGLYLYNTIVTEDSEGSICNFDTDLKDYLQNAVVTIPVDAGGISGLSIINCGKNLFNMNYLSATGITVINGEASGTTTNFHNNFGSGIGIGKIRFKPTTIYKMSFKAYTDGNIQTTGNGLVVFFLHSDNTRQYYSCSNDTLTYTEFNLISTTGKSVIDIGFTYNTGAPNIWHIKDIMVEEIVMYEEYQSYIGNTQSVTFTAPITDGAEVDLLSGIVKINTTPMTYDSITPIAIRTFKGINNVYSDIGDMSVTYKETLKHYLEKQDSNSRSLNRNVNLLRENISSTEDIVDDSDRRI